jgi:hypothetical protein
MSNKNSSFSIATLLQIKTPESDESTSGATETRDPVLKSNKHVAMSLAERLAG